MLGKSWFWGLLLVPLMAVWVEAAPSNLSAAEAYELLKKDSQVFLLDVRTSGEYMEARLEGARLIPIDELLARMGEVPKDRHILVYCAVGSRSSQVANFLAGRGYPEVSNMYGGIWAWQLRGLPVLKGVP